MKEIDYLGVNTCEEWTAALTDVFANATEAVVSGDDAQVGAVMQSIVEFTAKVPGHCTDLSPIAQALSTKLYAARMTAVLRSIAEHQRDLADAVEVARAVAEDNEALAEALLLVPLNDKLAGVRGAIDKAKNAIPDDAPPTVPELLDELETLGKRLDDLRPGA